MPPVAHARGARNGTPTGRRVHGARVRCGDDRRPAVPGRDLDLDGGRDRGAGAGGLPHGRSGAEVAGPQIPASGASAASGRGRGRAGGDARPGHAGRGRARAAPPPAGADQPARLAASRARRASPADHPSPAVRFRRQAVLRVAPRRPECGGPVGQRGSVGAGRSAGSRSAARAGARLRPCGRRTGTMCSIPPPGRSTGSSSPSRSSSSAATAGPIS